MHIEKESGNIQTKGKPPLLGWADSGLPQSGEELTRGGAGLPAPVRDLGRLSPASILEGAKVLVRKPVVHGKSTTKVIGPATDAVVAEEDLLVGFMAAITNDDRHYLALATLRVGLKTDATKLSEQDGARQSGSRVHVNGLGHENHDDSVIHPS